MKKRLADFTKSGLLHSPKEFNIFLIPCPSCEVIAEVASKEDADFFFSSCKCCSARFYIRFNFKNKRTELTVLNATQLLDNPDNWPMIGKITSVRKKDFM